MRKLSLALSALCLVIGMSGPAFARESAPATLYPGISTATLSSQAPVNWVSVAQIENSLLDRAPMAVGFDIDDTVLFSSPGFWRGQKEYSPGSQEFVNNPAFWEKMNNGWDKFSIPKEVAKALITMHVKRGDQIYFITARPQTKTETVTKILQEDFLIPETSMNPVIFSGESKKQNTKTQWIKDKKIRVFYGDSDNDITAAKEAGIRGIRVLRPTNSTNMPGPKAGSFGEEVIVNSEY